MGNQQGQPPQWPPQSGQPPVWYPPKQVQPSPYPQQPYYQAQTPYPPPYQQQPPPVKPKQKWTKKTTLGCAIIVSVLLLCSCVALAVAANASHPQTAVQGIPSSPTATTIALQATIAPATAIPTTRPTPTPKPTPTTVAQVQPTPKTTPKPQPTPTPIHATGIYGNTWGYNFNSAGGKLITNPPSNFCQYFPCITTFVSADDPDGGYIVQCQDGKFSQSGGESGSCSHHGGDGQPLYAH